MILLTRQGRPGRVCDPIFSQCRLTNRIRCQQQHQRQQPGITTS